MLRDNLVGLIEPMRISAGVDPLALSIQTHASDDRSSCLENPRPEGAESSLTENVASPFQAEPAHPHPHIMPRISDEPGLNEREDGTSSVIHLNVWSGDWKMAGMAALAGFQPANQPYKLGSFFARGIPVVLGVAIRQIRASKMV